MSLHTSTAETTGPVWDLLSVINAVILTVLFSAFWIWCGIQLVIYIF